MLYFAYGSNLDWTQMQDRCPGSHFHSRALLSDHRLAFSRYSQKRKGGVADIIPDLGQEVWGVVYELTDNDLQELDNAEGYQEGREKNSYLRVEREVCVEGDRGQPLQVLTYIAVQQPDPPFPNREYLDQIIRGARHWGLPAEYIKGLEKIPCG